MAPCLPLFSAPVLSQRVKVRAGSPKLRIGHGEFSMPAFIGQFEERMWSRSKLQQVRVNHHSTAAITKSCPSIRFAKSVLGSHLPRPHLFVAPKHVALRMAALGQQSVRKTNCFDCLTVI